MSILSRVLDLAESEGLNLKGLAERAEINYGNLLCVVRGERTLGPRLLTQIAAALGVTIDDLNPSAPPTWARFPKTNQDRLAMYQEQLANAKAVLTDMGGIGRVNTLHLNQFSGSFRPLAQS